jgi:hypothetical protein
MERLVNVYRLIRAGLTKAVLLQMSIEFRAVQIDQIAPDRVTWSSSRTGADKRTIPTAPVRLPVDDPSSVAVVSWRWDLDEATQTSRNASLAITQAARMGVRYLLIDLVSVDQQLRGDALMRAVTEFSDLYGRIPVIAAYDRVGVGQTEWTRIMRRPWILREARAFLANRNRIVYIGHVRGQGTDESLGFRHMLERIWSSSFTHSILHVLCGQVGMHSPSDLSFIMPEHATLLSVAYDQMSRNDFLLTAAILAQIPMEDVRLNEEIDLAEVDFGRYSFSPAPGRNYDSNKDIHLDGEKIATWMSHYNLNLDHHRRKLEVTRNAERIIHCVLGLSDKEFERYSARADERRRSLLLPAIRGADSPEIEIVYMDADSASGNRHFGL